MVFDTLALKEIPVIDQYSKLVLEIPNDIDYLIIMVCEVICPRLPARNIEDWGLKDPSGQGIEAFNNTRDIIIVKVLEFKSRIEMEL